MRAVEHLSRSLSPERGSGLFLLVLLCALWAGCALSGRSGLDLDARVWDAAAAVDAAVLGDAVGVPDSGCGGSLMECGGQCIDLGADVDNCGFCGNQCPSGVGCTSGECVVTLGASLSGRMEYPGSTVRIASDVTVTPYNGLDDVATCDVGETGCLHIVARRIEVLAGATIDAGGAGYGGGGGGGGGAGAAGFASPCYTGNSCVSCTHGSGGSGHGGGQDGSGASGADSRSISGAGGRGGGPFGGSGGDSVSSSSADGPRGGLVGGRGGYAGNGLNGDSTTDTSVRMGAGGGGGSGGACAYEPMYSSVGGSGGGGAGNPGGGYVVLEASVEIVVAGRITTAGKAWSRGDGSGGTNGAFGSYTCDLEGSGGNGGSAAATGGSAGGSAALGFFQAGYNACIDRQCENGGSHGVTGGAGGAGGAGAGGGVLLKAPSVVLSGTVDARGGGGSTTNGGTVKVFHQGAAPSTASVQAGRVYLATF